jgi:hypothetical protein
MSVNEPLFGGQEIEYVVNAFVRDGFFPPGDLFQNLSTGGHSDCGREYGVAVVNGIGALQVAMSASGRAMRS